MTRAVIVLVAAVLARGGTSLAAGPTMALQCDGSGADPWVTAFRDSVVYSDLLARYAALQYGDAVTCEGRVTIERDGVKFGTLLLTYPQGVTLELVTMPPQGEVATLRSGGGGFRDEVVAASVLKAYAGQRGVEIDWDVPEVSRDGPALARTFRDPDPGIDASASVFFLNERLVGLQLSLGARERHE